MKKLIGFLCICIALPTSLMGFFTVLSWIFSGKVVEDWQFLFMIVYLILVNRLIISPIEYFFDMKTQSYDPWFENIINKL
jgi:hypothetical protein